MSNPPKPLELRAMEAKGDGQDLSHRKAKPITYYDPDAPGWFCQARAHGGDERSIARMQRWYGDDWRSVPRIQPII